MKIVEILSSDSVEKTIISSTFNVQTVMVNQEQEKDGFYFYKS